MFFKLSDEATGLPQQLQGLLDQYNPYPERQVARLCRLAAATEDTQRGAAFRRMVLDVDSLLTDMRWHVGHALLILQAFPDLEKAENESVALFDKIGISNRAWALLRPLMAGHQQIYFDSMMEHRGGGGTVAGWILHMLVDDAVFRSISALDRIAHLLILAADLPAPRGRMYFRSGKFEFIEKTHGVAMPEAVVDLAASDDFRFLLDYRDGLAHTVRPIARAMRTPPADSYTTESGEQVRLPPAPWSAKDLVGIALLAFHLCSEALRPAADFCEPLIPVDDDDPGRSGTRPDRSPHKAGRNDGN